eukprot:scaffold64536_cov19-Tisochrysis_lutea.AAC.1
MPLGLKHWLCPPAHGKDTNSSRRCWMSYCQVAQGTGKEQAQVKMPRPQYSSFAKPKSRCPGRNIFNCIMCNASLQTLQFDGYGCRARRG